MIDPEKRVIDSAIIYDDDRFEIGVFGDNVILKDFAKDPYFEVYEKESENVIYFYFNKPHYTSLSYWSSETIREIDKILSDPNVWGKLVEEGFNKITGLRYIFEKPDYTKLERRK